MITVQILINGKVIYARSAVNITEREECLERVDGANKYEVDTGVHILHHPKDGAVVLAHKLLETITETGASKTITKKW